MNKSKKIISLLLSMTMMLSLAVPAFATEAEMPIPPAISAEDTATASGNFTDIDQLGNATYYVQRTDNYTVAIGLYNDVADCSIRYYDTDTLSSAIVPIEELSSFLPQTRSSNQTAQFESIKGAILNGSLPLEEVTFQSSSTPIGPTTRATSGEKAKIMTELYNAGWPQSYTNYLRASKTQNGITANLYHSVTYSVQDFDYTFVIAKTAVSALLAFTGLPTAKLKLIVTLALTVDGIYQTVKDVTIGKFDVYAYENKNVRINNVQYYWAGRTVKWAGVTGDIGAALTFDYENKHSDFYDNDGLLDTGLRNYANM